MYTKFWSFLFWKYKFFRFIFIGNLQRGDDKIMLCFRVTLVELHRKLPQRLLGFHLFSAPALIDFVGKFSLTYFKNEKETILIHKFMAIINIKIFYCLLSILSTSLTILKTFLIQYFNTRVVNFAWFLYALIDKLNSECI